MVRSNSTICINVFHIPLPHSFLKWQWFVWIIPVKHLLLLILFWEHSKGQELTTFLCFVFVLCLWWLNCLPTEIILSSCSDYKWNQFGRSFCFVCLNILWNQIFNKYYSYNLDYKFLGLLFISHFLFGTFVFKRIYLITSTC